MEGASAPEVVVGEYSLVSWLNMFWACHSLSDNSIVQWCWPNGKSLMEQEHLVVAMFRLLRIEAQRWVNDKLREAIDVNG